MRDFNPGKALAGPKDCGKPLTIDTGRRHSSARQSRRIMASSSGRSDPLWAARR